MENGRWQRIKQLFDEGLPLAPPERRAFLGRVCGDDRSLQDEVESLIDAYVRSGAFLDTSSSTAAHALVTDFAVRSLGPYELGPMVGAGGMGAVYVARDTRLNRKVAIKVRADSAAWGIDLREQFAREAKTISALNHPHICSLHDVGRHDGVDYLVMEFVEGEPIDAYCDRHGLSLRSRLTLFSAVCEAVHYAHQNLVVHRDLKPSNVLVTSDGQPKLLDFGVARFLTAAENAAGVTATLPLLTPDYASPEQVRGGRITTASDVYSLGVMLYELLAGCRPFDVRAAALEEMVTTICQTQPPRPSVARRRSAVGLASSSRLGRELEGDLDTIVLKALRKEPDRRYLSAQALADDIRRHLGGLVVAARGDAVMYRVSTFARRHRVAALIGVVFVVGLLAAMALILRQAGIAEAERARAERRFADVRRLAGSFLFEFHDAIRQLPGSTRARALVATRALEYLDSLAQESADDPTLRAELGRAYQRVADVQGGFREANLGSVADAVSSYRKALALQEALMSSGTPDRALKRDLARTLLGLGDAQLMQRDIAGALESFRRLLALREAAAAGEAPTREIQRELAIGQHRVADALGQLGDPKAAVSGVRRAIAALEPLAADVQDVESRHALARSFKTLGSWLAAQRDLEGYLAMASKALEISEALAAADPLNMSLRHETAVCALQQGLAHLRLDHFDPALASFRRAGTLWASMMDADPSNVQARWMRGLNFNLLGATFRQMGGHEREAIAVHLEALPLLEGLSRTDPANENYRYNVANTLQLVGNAYGRLARRTSPGAGRHNARTAACDWYARSDAAFEAMRQRGKLTGAFIPDAEAVRAELTRCGGERGTVPSPGSITR